MATGGLRHGTTVVLAVSADIPSVTVVFVYGTLTDPNRVSELLTNYTFGPAAVCHGLRRVDGRYPTLVPGGQVAGRLLSTTEVDRLDGYEGVDRGLYCRVRVPRRSPHGSRTGDRSHSDQSAFAADTVDIYVGDPTALGISGTVGWPEAEGFGQSVNTHIETHSVQVVIENTHR